MTQMIQRVVVIGGGAAGTLVAAHLLREGRVGEVVLMERSQRVGPGLAYGTEDSSHLLNAPVKAMSAFADEPDQFLRWLDRHSIDAQPYDFVPRAQYGTYLTETLAAVERQSATVLHRVHGEVESVQLLDGVDATTTTAWPVIVRLSGGRCIGGDRAVLAIGHARQAPVALPAAPTAAVADLRKACWIDNPWPRGALDRIRDRDRVVLVGTGLTMVDVVLALRAHGHRGEMTAISRRGLLPEPHPRVPTAPMPFSPPHLSTARQVVHAVRAAVRQADVIGVPRQAAIDGMRPHVQRVWGGLPVAERSRLLRHAMRWWEVQRHRMAPEAGTEIKRLQAEGQLRIIRGHLADCRAGTRGLHLDIAHHGSVRALFSEWVVVCTGLDVDPRRSGPVLDGLLARGWARPGPLGLGLDTDADGALIDTAGRASDLLFTLGMWRKGELWETTAVPEIRLQAAALAGRLTQPVARPLASSSSGSRSAG